MLQQNIKGVVDTLKKYDFPCDVVVETIAYCNMECVMCPQKILKRPRGEMSFELWKKIVDEIVERNINTRIWPSLMGDATLLGEKIVSMVQYATGRGAQIHFNTNGMAFVPPLADEIMDSGIQAVYFGIDGFKPETYERIRVGGKYETVVGNIRHAIKIKKPEQKVYVQFIEMEENTDEMEDFKKFWLNEGAVVKLRPKLAWGGEKSKFLKLTSDERVPCGWLVRTTTVRWDGHMLQCDSDYEGIHSPGDINKQTLHEVWNGELAKRRQYHWDGDFSHYCCKDCNDWQMGRSHIFHPEEK